MLVVHVEITETMCIDEKNKSPEIVIKELKDKYNLTDNAAEIAFSFEEQKIEKIDKHLTRLKTYVEIFRDIAREHDAPMSTDFMNNVLTSYMNQCDKYSKKAVSKMLSLMMYFMTRSGGIDEIYNL